MTTQCFSEQIEFQGLGQCKVSGDFSAPQVSSDASALLLKEVDQARGLLEKFSQGFTDS